MASFVWRDQNSAVLAANQANRARKAAIALIVGGWLHTDGVECTSSVGREVKTGIPF
jgi:hypothetical protein